MQSGFHAWYFLIIKIGYERKLCCENESHTRGRAGVEFIQLNKNENNETTSLSLLPCWCCCVPCSTTDNTRAPHTQYTTKNCISWAGAKLAKLHVITRTQNVNEHDKLFFWIIFFVWAFSHSFPLFCLLLADPKLAQISSQIYVAEHFILDDVRNVRQWE